VELALAGAIGMARDEHQAEDGDRVRDGGHEALADVAEAPDLVDDLADPEGQAVDVDDHAEVQEAEHEDAPVLQRAADRVAVALEARRLLALQALGQPLLLVGLRIVRVCSSESSARGCMGSAFPPDPVQNGRCQVNAGGAAGRARWSS
jgi:hypothetical protein